MIWFFLFFFFFFAIKAWAGYFVLSVPSLLFVDTSLTCYICFSPNQDTSTKSRQKTYHMTGLRFEFHVFCSLLCLHHKLSAIEGRFGIDYMKFNMFITICILRLLTIECQTCWLICAWWLFVLCVCSLLWSVVTSLFAVSGFFAVCVS